MKMKFLMKVKIFIIGLCGIGLLVTYFSFPSVKNVWALDMEDLMESIQESVQESVKQTIKQQTRQETTAVITETKVEPTVATSGDATTTTTTTTTDTTTTSCDLTGTWFDSAHDETCSFTQSGSSFSGTCEDDFDDHSESLSGTLTDSSSCIYSYTLTESWSDEFGSCTETYSGSATLSGSTITWSETLSSHSGSASDCGLFGGDSGTLTKQ